VAQQGQAAAVGPVGIVQHQQERGSATQSFAEGDHVLEQALLLGFRVQGRVGWHLGEAQAQVGRQAQQVGQHEIGQSRGELLASAVAEGAAQDLGKKGGLYPLDKSPTLWYNMCKCAVCVHLHGTIHLEP